MEVVALSLMGLVWFGFLILLLLLLQVGDVAYSVPNSLVVTLERVLGNETIGKVQFFVMRAFVLLLLLVSNLGF